MKENILRNFNLMSNILHDLLEQNQALKNLKVHMYRGDKRQLTSGVSFGNKLISFSLDPNCAKSFTISSNSRYGTIIHIYHELNEYMIPIMQNCRNRTIRHYDISAFHNEDEILFLPNIIMTTQQTKLCDEIYMNTPQTYWNHYAKIIEPSLDLIFDSIKIDVKTVNYIDYLKSVRFDWQQPDKNYYTFLLHCIKKYLPPTMSHDENTLVNNFLINPEKFKSPYSIETIKNYIYYKIAFYNFSILGDKFQLSNVPITFAETMIDSVHDGGNPYYLKYLKYKQKYLQIK